MLRLFFSGEADLGELLAWLFALAIAITVHEYAHAKRADLAGDPTPRAEGRLTLNPLAHYDIIGSTLILLFGFGWAKPVPINPLAFRHPRRDLLFVSLWGPLSNFVTAAILALPLRLHLAGDYAMPLMIIVYLNIALGVFNLIPVPPLDGSHILEALLPPRQQQKLARWAARNIQWMILAFFLIMFVPMLNKIFFTFLHIPIGALFWLLTGHDI